MRKLLIIILLLGSLPVFAQTIGSGWKPQNFKANNRDSSYFHKDVRFNSTLRINENALRIGAVLVGTNGPEFNILDGALVSTPELNRLVGVTSGVQTQLNGKANTSHTQTQISVTALPDSLLNKPTKAQMNAFVRKEIGDSLASAKAGETLAISAADSNQYAPEYYATPNFVRDHVSTYGGSVKRASFIIGATSGAPDVLDSLAIHPYFDGKHIDLYRNGALQYFHTGSVNTLDSTFRVSNDTITVRPAWANNEKIIIDVTDTTRWDYFAIGSPLLDSLMLYYDFNESSGLTAYDATETQDATLYSGIERVTSKSGFGNAAHTSTVNDYIRSPYNAATNIDTTFSLSMWFYLDSVPTEAGTGYLFYAFHGAAPWYSYAISLESDNTLRFTARNLAGTAYSTYSPAILQDSTWYHLVVTCRGNGYTSQIYLNGTDVSTAAVTFIGGVFNTNNYLYFGNQSPTAIYTCPNRVDEIALYNRVLTAEDVAALYNSGAGKLYPFWE